jgi:LuxR family maltose regulon positive regulatory protein
LILNTSTPLLATKLYLPWPRPNLVRRPHLVERLQAGLQGKLTLISAPAGFGKTTLLSEWVAAPRGHPALPVAWLALDAGDNDPARFLAYLVAALQTVAPALGKGVLAALHAPQPPPVAAMLAILLDEIAAVPHPFVLVLDDYHLLNAKPVGDALAFLLAHQPPQMHLVIATREDPPLPLARLRAGGHLTELRAADLRFSTAEATGFLYQTMGLTVSADVAALEARTEGWIAGLQLAALALQGTLAGHGEQDAAGFIRSFTGSHRFVLDYLLEEVLLQQPESVQTFLLRTLILTACAVPSATPCWTPRPVSSWRPGRRSWNLSNAPTSSSSPWTTNGAGIVITISSPICCGSDCNRAIQRRT